jgi:exodeoxyribonuclease V alpha subunit
VSSSSASEVPATEFEHLAGLVERVTFHNEQNGFCVLRLNVKGERELITLIGHAPAVFPGEYASASGHWVTDREHGRQFRAVFVKISPPTTLTGIERYLGSGLVKGIGPVYAGKLVQAFGAAVFDVIEQSSQRLREIPGIGDVRAQKIRSGWTAQKIIRSVMVFLHAHGVSTSRAVRIFKTYGQDAIKLVSENPYRLVREIRGIGFLSADTIAQKIGIARDSPLRAQAGVSYALSEASSQGHCGLPYAELLPRHRNAFFVVDSPTGSALRPAAARPSIRRRGNCPKGRRTSRHFRSAAHRLRRDGRTGFCFISFGKFGLVDKAGASEIYRVSVLIDRVHTLQKRRQFCQRHRSAEM